MTALLDHRAPIEDDDPIRVADGGQAVGDDDRGSVLLIEREPVIRKEKRWQRKLTSARTRLSVCCAYCADDFDRAVRARGHGGGYAAERQPFNAPETSGSDENTIRVPLLGFIQEHALRVAILDQRRDR
jgi:hypothetical protein